MITEGGIGCLYYGCHEQLSSRLSRPPSSSVPGTGGDPLRSRQP
ncbi:hypothetical protein NSERUTF1_6337 [Nocardia seriolae]|nr:hypothetical protein NSERUTF1_6337 [Nocardia seriolae]